MRQDTALQCDMQHSHSHLPEGNAWVLRLDALAVGVGEEHEARQRLLGRIGVLLLARLARLLALACGGSSSTATMNSTEHIGGALGSFFLRGLRAFLPSPAGAAAAQQP
jgi:hypothetical protein